MAENLSEGLKRELKRNREILKYYEEIPEGIFGATMIKQDIEYAEQAMLEGNVVNMITAFKRLEENKE